MKWKLPPKREDKVARLVREISELIDSDVTAMSKVTGQRQAQCLASILRPIINMQRPNVGPEAFTDRRRKPWRVQCRFGFNDGSNSLDDDGEFDWETVRGFDEVIELVRDCFDDYHEPTGAVWGDVEEFNDRQMKQRFGGLYSNISKGGGEANTRIFYDTVNDVPMFLDVTVEREQSEAGVREQGQKNLDLEEINEDSPKPAVSRLRAMREARGQS